jgi:hypothetical protein
LLAPQIAFAKAAPPLVEPMPPISESENVGF